LTPLPTPALPLLAAQDLSRRDLGVVFCEGRISELQARQFRKF